MPVSRYGVFKGQPVSWTPPIGGTHATLLFRGEDGSEIAAVVNVEAQCHGSELLCWVDRQFDPAQLPSPLLALDFGSHLASKENESPSLDLIQQALLEPGKSIVAPVADEESIFHELSKVVDAAVNHHAVAYVFGSLDDGLICNVHMNQGGIGYFRQENAASQDGGILLHFADDHWEAIFIAFASQASKTDEHGDPAGPLLRTYHESLVRHEKQSARSNRQNQRIDIDFADSRRSAESLGAIRSKTAACKALFQTCQNYPVLSEVSSIDQMYAKFNWWSLGIGAEKSGRSSLDNRVRRREDVQSILTGLLDSLSISLQNCIDIAKAAQADPYEAVRVLEVPEMKDKETEPELASNMTSLLGEEPRSRLGDQCYYIEANIEFLSRISTAIRKYGTKFRHEKADQFLLKRASDLQEFREFLTSLVLIGPLQHALLSWTVHTKFPAPEWSYERLLTRLAEPKRLSQIQQRLIEANLVRRNRFDVYFEQYRRRLEEDGTMNEITPGASLANATTNPPTKSPDSLPASSQRPREDTYATIKHEADKPPQKKVDTVDRSVVSSEHDQTVSQSFIIPDAPEAAESRSVGTRVSQGVLKQDYPKCPAADGNHFWCPCCAQVLDSSYSDSKKDKNLKKWRGHVAEDLIPYACPYFPCPKPVAEAMYATTNEWKKHLQEFHSAPRWICDTCWLGSEDPSQFEFVNEDEWRLHIRLKHQGEYKEDNLPALAKASLRTAVPSIACPLCHDETTLLQPETDKHIAEHLHSFALEALPWEAIGPDDDTKASLGSDDNQPVAVAADVGSEASQESAEDVRNESYDIDKLLQTVPESCKRIESVLPQPEIEWAAEWALVVNSTSLVLRHVLFSIVDLEYSNHTSPVYADIATQLAYVQNLLTMIENLNMTTDAKDPETLRTLGTLQQNLASGQKYLVDLIQLAKSELQDSQPYESTDTVGSLFLDAEPLELERKSKERPSSRDEFEIAIACAVSFEVKAVCDILDDYWDDDYGKAPGDENYYSNGRIGSYNVVVLTTNFFDTGNKPPALALKASYPGIRLVLLVGVCGGVPLANGVEILLGDVIISTSTSHYESEPGYRIVSPLQMTDGHFAGAEARLHNTVEHIQTEVGRHQFRKKTAMFLKDLQAQYFSREKEKEGGQYRYPGADKDRLFRADYRHKHRNSPACICRDCNGNSDPVCADALSASCYDLGCDQLELRLAGEMRETALSNVHKIRNPDIHFGPIYTGLRSVRSAENRDLLAQRRGVLAFAIKGPDFAKTFSFLSVKGVCNYADGHKDRIWEKFAAVTAASAAKAFLSDIFETERHQERLIHPQGPPLARRWSVPFKRNRAFVGREEILDQIMELIPPSRSPEDCQLTAIHGLGGVGKTQIALEAVFRIQDLYRDCSVIWVSAADGVKSYAEGIGGQLQVTGTGGSDVNTVSLVQGALNLSGTSWLLVVDDADDPLQVFGGADSAASLVTYLPTNVKGSILFITENRQVAERLGIPSTSIITAGRMTEQEAVTLLKRGIYASLNSTPESMRSLVDALAYLPLAILQASEYMVEIGMPVPTYLRLFESGQKSMIRLLSDHRNDTRKALVPTLLAAFSNISRDSHLAAAYLRFMCFLDKHDIFVTLLPPPGSDNDADEAIGLLKAYSFINERIIEDVTNPRSLDIHPLVQAIVRDWLGDQGMAEICVSIVVNRLTQVFPVPTADNQKDWLRYLPHAQVALTYLDKIPISLETAELLYLAGQSFYILGKYHDAELLLQKSVHYTWQCMGEDHPLAFPKARLLVRILHAQGQYDDATLWCQQMLEKKKRWLGPEHPDTLDNMEDLALELKEQRKYEEAEDLYLRVNRLRGKILGEDHPNTIQGIEGLARMLNVQQRYKEAEDLFRRANVLRRQTMGEHHPETLKSMEDLAGMLSNQGKYEQAEDLYKQVLHLRMETMGTANQDTITTMEGLAHILNRRKKYSEADNLHRQACQLRQETLGETHPDTIRSLASQARLLSDQGKYQESEDLYSQLIRLRTDILGERHPDTISNMGQLAAVLDIQGKSEQARLVARRALDLAKEVLGTEDTLTKKITEYFAALSEENGLERKQATMGQIDP